MMTRICAALLLCTSVPAAQAQDGVDWGSIMHAEAMGSATVEAAREGSHTQPARRDPPKPGNPETRANCAKVRGWIANGNRDARLPRLLGLCKQLGY